MVMLAEQATRVQTRPGRRPGTPPAAERGNALYDLNNAAGWVLDAVRTKMDEFISEPLDDVSTVGMARAYLLSQARVLELIDREITAARRAAS